MSERSILHRSNGSVGYGSINSHERTGLNQGASILEYYSLFLPPNLSRPLLVLTLTLTLTLTVTLTLPLTLPLTLTLTLLSLSL